MSLLEENLIDNVNPDEEISNSIESQITSLKKIISNLNKKDTNLNEADIDEEEESEFSSWNTNLIKIKLNFNNLDKIPGKFQGTYIDIGTIMGEYVNDFNQFFYSSFKDNSGIQLLEEKVKLDIYSLINEAF